MVMGLELALVCMHKVECNVLLSTRFGNNSKPDQRANLASFPTYNWNVVSLSVASFHVLTYRTNKMQQ